MRDNECYNYKIGRISFDRKIVNRRLLTLLPRETTTTSPLLQYKSPGIHNRFFRTMQDTVRARLLRTLIMLTYFEPAKTMKHLYLFNSVLTVWNGKKRRKLLRNKSSERRNTCNKCSHNKFSYNTADSTKYIYERKMYKISSDTARLDSICLLV